MIVFENVSKEYKTRQRPALDNVNMVIEPGEFVFLVGPSGSGKSTFLRLCLREEKASSGIVRIGEEDVAQIPHRSVHLLRRRLGIIFQDYRLLPNKTVFQNVAFALEVVGKDREHVDVVVPGVLDLVGLGNMADRYPHELSGGEQQRVAIARAFANHPEILLADEPTGNLDPENSNEILDLLNKISLSGTTVIMATHDAGLVDRMQKRVIELDEGHVVRDEKIGSYV